MKILFTKKNLDKKLISKYLGNQFSYDFVDVIKTKNLKVQPFDLGHYSLIFTSVNGVDSFFENGFKPNEKFTDRNYNRIYCVGEKTKNEIRKHGFLTYKVKKHAKDLSEFIIANSLGERFYHFCGNLALDILDRALPLQNIQYKKVPVYETQLLYPVVNEEFNVLAFFSPSGVRSFIKHNSLEGKKLFAIGQTTEKELKKHTKNTVWSSEENNFEGLLKLLAKQLTT